MTILRASYAEADPRLDPTGGPLPGGGLRFCDLNLLLIQIREQAARTKGDVS